MISECHVFARNRDVSDLEKKPENSNKFRKKHGIIDPNILFSPASNGNYSSTGKTSAAMAVNLG
jgi:hypothetical protein